MWGFLVFFYGNINDDHCWRIQMCDKDVLEKIKILMNLEHRILKQTYNGNNYLPIYKLCVCSIKMVADLNKLGVFQRKSLTIQWPNRKFKRYQAVINNLSPKGLK